VTAKFENPKRRIEWDAIFASVFGYVCGLAHDRTTRIQIAATATARASKITAAAAAGTVITISAAVKTAIVPSAGSAFFILFSLVK
jgi:hypothetical protein